MSFRTQDLAFDHYRTKGFRYDNTMSIREAKWFMFRKCHRYVIIPPKYDSIMGTKWVARSFV